MSRRPDILDGGRRRALAMLVALSFGQGGAMIATAFATRDVFIYLRAGGAAVPIDALAVLAAGGLVLAVCRALEGRVGEQAGQSYAAAIRRALFQHISRMPLSAISSRRSGALALRYVGDLAAFKGWIARGIARLISALVTIPAALLVLYLFEPWLLVATIGPLVAVLAGIALLGGPLGSAHADLRKRRARLAAHMAERLPQGIQLRRSGRMRTELKALAGWSQEVADAGIRRETLAATVRALPDAGAGCAAALCLGACIQLGLGVPEAVAALTALAMIIWPLRQLADVSDRRRAFLVASAKLDRMLATPRLETKPKARQFAPAPAVLLEEALMPDGSRLNLRLEKGALRRLSGPPGSGKTSLLRALAGFEMPFAAKSFTLFGSTPGALTLGQVLYLGSGAPSLAGSLRREVTLGIGRQPNDAEIERALETAGLGPTCDRLGGLMGKVFEGRRNLTATEQTRLLLVRGLLSRPDIALIDADDLGLDSPGLNLLLEHLTEISAAGLVVTSDPKHMLRLGQPIALSANPAAVADSVPRRGAGAPSLGEVRA
jgi:ABC-type transport system involved in cytochrome bd biosynthesis fused ATPase/permease subunit